MFRSLSLTPFDQTRVMICGQDPYPDMRYADGLAFSVPSTIKTFPKTLQAIFSELVSDLHIKHPSAGCLEPWAKQGVLLWNVIPSCEVAKPLSHDWTEWSYLTIEILRKLSGRGVVFVFLGGVAREFVPYLPVSEVVIQLTHPSPRVPVKAKNPFLGSRVFSTINAEILGDPIDWSLP